MFAFDAVAMQTRTLQEGGGWVSGSPAIQAQPKQLSNLYKWLAAEDNHKIMRHKDGASGSMTPWVPFAPLQEEAAFSVIYSYCWWHEIGHHASPHACIYVLPSPLC